MSESNQAFDHYEVAAMRGEFTVLASIDDEPYRLTEIACFHDRERADIYAKFCNGGDDEAEAEPDDRETVDDADDAGAEDGEDGAEESVEPIAAAEVAAEPKEKAKPKAAAPALVTIRDRVFEAVSLLSAVGGVGAKMIRERTGLKALQVRVALIALSKKGLIHSEGNTNKARWFVAKKADATEAEPEPAKPETKPPETPTPGKPIAVAPETKPKDRLAEKCLYWLQVNIGDVKALPGDDYFLEGASQPMSAKSMIHFCNEKRRTAGLEPFEAET